MINLRCRSIWLGEIDVVQYAIPSMIELLQQQNHQPFTYPALYFRQRQEAHRYQQQHPEGNLHQKNYIHFTCPASPLAVRGLTSASAPSPEDPTQKHRLSAPSPSTCRSSNTSCRFACNSPRSYSLTPFRDLLFSLPSVAYRKSTFGGP